MTSRLARIVQQTKISPQILLFFFHNFFINVGTTLVYVSANILLLENHPEYSLPIAYIAAALVVMVAGKIYEYFEHHLTLEKLSTGTMMASLFMVLVVMVLLWTGHGVATAVAIMVGYRIIYLLINLEFWGLSALAFDVRQSKRLFSVIGSGDMPAKALGAVLAVLIHAPSVLIILLFISLIFFALAFYTQKLTFRHTDIPNPHHARPRNSDTLDSKIIQRYFGGNRLVTALCVGTVFVAAASVWIEYHFFVNVKYKFHSQHEIILFAGSLLTATYLISTFVKLLFSAKTVERFGVRLTLYLLPVSTILVSLGLIVSTYFRKDEPSLLVYYCVAYMLFEMIRRSIFDPVFLVLFQPLSTKNRLKGHTLAKGLYEPMGMLIAGLILWTVYTMKWSDIGLTFDLSLLFAVAATIAFRWAYAEYARELKNAISKRFLRSGEMASPGEALPFILDNLKSDRKDEVINAVDWLARYHKTSLKTNVENLLSNPNSTVRLKLLGTLMDLKENWLPASFTKYIENEPDSACQTLAVRLACAHSLLSEEMIAFYISHEDPDIVRGTIIGCWESGKFLPLVHGTLAKMFRSVRPEEQIVALQCIRAIGLRSYETIVVNLLVSPSTPVKHLAIELIGASKEPDLLKQLQAQLSGPECKPAVAALVAAGDEGFPVLDQWIASNPDEKYLVHFCMATAKAPSEKTLSTLLKLIQSTYHLQITNLSWTIHLRTVALRALAKHLPTANTASIAFEFIDFELIHAAQLISGLRSYQNNKFGDAISDELTATTQRLFYLFEVIFDKDAVANAWKGIKHLSREKRANSLEMIESLLPRTLYPVLRALFEHEDLQKQSEALLTYLGDRYTETSIVDYTLHHRERFFSHWTIAMAMQRADQSALDPTDISALLGHSSRLISETAYLQFSNTNQKEQPAMNHNESTDQVSELERIIVLKSTQLFGQTPESVLSSIAPIMKEVTFSESQQIFLKGDTGDSMYIIYAGEVGIYDGPKRLALFDKGEIFGELALMDTEPRSATTVAETDVMLFRIDQEDFMELMEERDEILKNVLRILCQRIRVQNVKMRELSEAI